MNALVGRLRDRVRLSPDDGFSLIEVVVAIVIVGTLTVTSLGIFLSSMEAANSQQRRQIAITVANESMESVSAWSTALVNVVAAGEPDVSALYTGRHGQAVRDQWAANPGVSGIDQTYARWNPDATAASVPSLPLTRTVTRSGTRFTVKTFIGACYLSKSGGSCTKIAGSPTTPPASLPSTVTPMIRIIVDVSWTAGSSCEAGDCTYTVSTLVNTNTDLEWKSTSAP